MDQLRRRWPVSQVTVVLGAMARTGVLSPLANWDINNTGEVPGLILSRLLKEEYLRELWTTVICLNNNQRGNHLGNPRSEAFLMTSLAIMDYLQEICPRRSYQKVFTDGNGD